MYCRSFDHDGARRAHHDVVGADSERVNLDATALLALITDVGHGDAPRLVKYRYLMLLQRHSRCVDLAAALMSWQR